MPVVYETQAINGKEISLRIHYSVDWPATAEIDVAINDDTGKVLPWDDLSESQQERLQALCSEHLNDYHKE